MAFGRGHASFTIDTLKLAKDSLPAAVTEPPPVFPVGRSSPSFVILFDLLSKELLTSPHPLNENPANDYDYKLKVKANFNSHFRALHNSSTRGKKKGECRLNSWKEGEKRRLLCVCV